MAKEKTDVAVCMERALAMAEGPPNREQAGGLWAIAAGLFAMADALVVDDEEVDPDGGVREPTPLHLRPTGTGG